MGSAYSKALQEEKQTWSLDHSLNIDRDHQNLYTNLISSHFENGATLQLRKRNVKAMESIDYIHYSIATKKSPRWTIEFGNGSTSSHTVTVQCIPESDSTRTQLEHEFTMTDDVRTRMNNVVGAKAYSAALRNSEHVARYICSGRWISLQTVSDDGPGIGYYFPPIRLISLVLNDKHSLLSSDGPGFGHCLKQELKKEGQHQKLNKFPIELLPRPPPESGSEIVRGMDPIIKYEGTGQRVENSTYNIAVIGPTGSGKSQFINRLFNQYVCESGPSARSATKEITTYRGNMESLDGEIMPVNVIDTIGFCDSTLKPEEVCKVLKNYLELNFGLIDKVIVLTSGRIEAGHRDSIRQILEWLKFHKNKQNKGCFLFLYNKTDLCPDEQTKAQNVIEMIEELGTGNFDSDYKSRDGKSQLRVAFNMPLGIPPDATKEDTQEALGSIRIQLDKFVSTNGERQRIEVNPSSCVIL